MQRREFLQILYGFFSACLLPRVAFSQLKTDNEIDGMIVNVQGKKSEFSKPLVLRIENKNVIKETVNNKHYIEAIDHVIVKEMLDECLLRFTYSSNTKEAWKKILKNPGRNDKVAIKPNFNGVETEFREVITSPQLINAILYGLIEKVGLKEKNIYIYDMARVIPDYLRNRIYYRVNFVQGYPTTILGKIRKKIGLDELNTHDWNEEIHMTERITDQEGNLIKCYVPKLISEVDHLINVPILKGHIFVLISGSLKNHYGTVRFSDGAISPKVLHPPRLDQSVVDINKHPQILKKTRIIIADSLMASYDGVPGTGPLKWKVFSASHPASLFISKDPVALDSVLADYVKKERLIRDLEIRPHDYLELAGAKKLGVYEHSDGSIRYEYINYQSFRV